MNRLATFLLLLVGPSLATSQETIAIVDGHLISLENGQPLRSPGTAIVATDGVITAIGSNADTRVPDDALVIEADGAYVIPGLTDMHVHIGHESERLLYLRYGVTTVCNLGGDGLDLFRGERLDILALRDRIRAGELEGPDIYSTGTALDGDPPSGPFQKAVPDVESARRIVREQLEAGFDFIKVYDALPPEVHAAIVATAKEAGVVVFGHVPEALGVEGTLASGQTVIAHAEEYHGAFASASEDGATEAELAGLAERTREAGVVVIPNTSFVRNVLEQLDDLSAVLSRPETRFIAPNVRGLWEPRYNYLVRRDDPAAFEEQMAAKYDFVHGLTRALHDAGVLLLAGSDASVPCAVPGLSLHGELADLVEAGLSPEGALRTSTTNVRTFFAQHLPDAPSFGTLRVGARADLVLLEKDPLASIENLDSILGVMSRGNWHERADLDAKLEELAQRFAR